MSTQLKVLFVRSKVPTQSALNGAKTTSPFFAVVAPMNLTLPLMLDGTSTQVKALVVGSKTPTQSALYGAKTTSPLLAVVAPLNL